MGLLTGVRSRRILRTSPFGSSRKSTYEICISPVLWRKARPRWPSHNGGRHRRVPIPLQAGIKAHDLREENAHLEHIQGLIRALQRVTISVLSRACLYPPPRRPGFSLACVPVLCGRVDTGWVVLTAENDYGGLEDYFVVLCRRCKEGA
jgi:hypothetical protein